MADLVAKTVVLTVSLRISFEFRQFSRGKNNVKRFVSVRSIQRHRDNVQKRAELVLCFSLVIIFRLRARSLRAVDRV